MASNIRVDIRSNMKDLLAKTAALPERLLKQATYRALNRALDKSATETSREIRKVYNVRDKVIKSAISKRKAHRNNLASAMAIEGWRIPLIEFGARWRRRMPIGATVEIRKGSRRPIPGAFIAMGRRGLQVFRRINLADPRSRIIVLRTVSIPQQFNNPQVREAVQRATHEAFTKNYEQQITFMSR